MATMQAYPRYLFDRVASCLGRRVWEIGIGHGTYTQWIRDRSATVLATDIDTDCLQSVGPQHGAHVTDALPGFSWHQWGEAVDCFWLLDGKAEWSTSKKVNGVNGYAVYANEAEAVGLVAGGHWTRFKDWPHVQLRAASSPARALTLLQIDTAMKVRFGG